MHIKTKRVYEKPDKTDGFRILVDRLWPRGVTKEKAVLDFWLKDIAPVRNCENGLIMNPKKGKNSSENT